MGRGRGWGDGASSRSPPTPTLPAASRGRERAAHARATTCLAQLHQRRQKSRQRLAGAGRRDQQHRAAGARLRQQFELMRARRPAALREPARERLGQRRVFGAFEDGHRLEVMLRRRHRRGRLRRHHDQPGNRDALLPARRGGREADDREPGRRRARHGHEPRRGRSAGSRAAARPAPSWVSTVKANRPPRRARAPTARAIGARSEQYDSESAAITRSARALALAREEFEHVGDMQMIVEAGAARLLDHDRREIDADQRVDARREHARSRARCRSRDRTRGRNTARARARRTQPSPRRTGAAARDSRAPRAATGRSACAYWSNSART